MATIDDIYRKCVVDNAPHDSILYDMLYERGDRERPSILELVKIDVIAFINIFLRYNNTDHVSKLGILCRDSIDNISDIFVEHYKKKHLHCPL